MTYEKDDIRNDPRFKEGCHIRNKASGTIYQYYWIKLTNPVLKKTEYEFVDIVPSPEPETVVRYVNLYKDEDGILTTGSTHSTLEQAKEAAKLYSGLYSNMKDKVVGRVKFVGIEGYFEE